MGGRSLQKRSLLKPSSCQDATLNSKPQTPHLEPKIPNPKPQIPDPKSQTPNLKPQTPDPKPQTLRQMAKGGQQLAKARRVQTEGGCACALPFAYGGKAHGGCTRRDSHRCTNAFWKHYV